LSLLILNVEIHAPPKLSWAPVRRTGCTPLSWGQAIIRVLVIQASILQLILFQVSLRTSSVVAPEVNLKFKGVVGEAIKALLFLIKKSGRNAMKNKNTVRS